MNTIIAVDPGKNGGIAVYGNGKVSAIKMPGTTADLQTFLRHILDTHENITVFIEKVQAFGTDKDTPGKSFGINKLLANYHKLVTCIELMGLKYVEVYPISWQTTLKLKWKEDISQQERKRRYKEFAIRCFPEVPKVTLATGDALCIIQFALVKISNDISWIRKRLKNKNTGKLF